MQQKLLSKLGVMEELCGNVLWGNQVRSQNEMLTPISEQQEVMSKLGVANRGGLAKAARRVQFAPEVTRGATIKTGYASDLCLCETHEPEGVAEVLASEIEWQDVEFEVALDSGAQDHVCDEVDCPGYVTEVSPGSSRGQCFVVGNGGRLDNLGQRALNLSPFGEPSTSLQSSFQIARVTQPLMSVGKICDNGLKVEFDDVQAVARDKTSGALICFIFTTKRRLVHLYISIAAT